MEKVRVIFMGREMRKMSLNCPRGGAHSVITVLYQIHITLMPAMFFCFSFPYTDNQEGRSSVKTESCRGDQKMHGKLCQNICVFHSKHEEWQTEGSQRRMETEQV